MGKGTDKFVKNTKQVFDNQFKFFNRHLGEPLAHLLDIPVRVILSPFTLYNDISGSVPRGFGIPEFISKISYSAIFAVAALGTCDIALELGKKVICQRNCQTCNGWNALRCTMCRGTGKVMYQVKNYTLRSLCIFQAPWILMFHCPPKTDTCDGSGVMKCPECKDKLQVRISADDIIDPPWKAYNIMKKMDYPYEHIIDSMKDPSIAAFWLITMPQIMGGFEYDDEVKQKIWWQYKENMRYVQLRDAVAKRKPGWEYLQEGLISMDPERARNDPVVVKNIPYYKAKAALETEVMKLNPPPRPQKWGDLNVPLNASSWSEEDLKDPKKLYEMTVLLNAQREIAEKILDDQWEAKWRQEQLNKMLEEKLQPYIQNIENGVLPQPILAGPPKNDQKVLPIFFQLQSMFFV
ncbi:hypothetical protein L1987_26653 [Smallanthus sonchifolius]|uniref:Uncharacterized protein n=1 Tax=Smallanthus sonchifolius TaxID=185202 RepID=A0ACB9I999_9ASTR|nr:hypothetical protein L1987_26653 [Smallanthus sonchifolius]